MDFSSVLAAIWQAKPDQIPVLMAGSSIISYCKACWKVCQMDVPPGKDPLSINMSDFRCLDCAGVVLAPPPPSSAGDPNAWHRPDDLQTADRGFQLGYKDESQFVNGQVTTSQSLLTSEGIRVVSF
jgi:hypothetical protein